MHKKRYQRKIFFVYMNTYFLKKILSIWKTGKIRPPGMNHKRKKLKVLFKLKETRKCDVVLDFLFIKNPRFYVVNFVSCMKIV